MKIGSLVVPKDEYAVFVPGPDPDNMCAGIVIGFDYGDVIIYWNEKFSEEREYTHQLEVLNV